MREDWIHFHVRRELTNRQWRLVAGQYPGGSDELPALNVVDPLVARDHSPDPRRHSLNKLVPDLVACSGADVLLVEMKDEYDPGDVLKLRAITEQRLPDLIVALERLSVTRPGRLCDTPTGSSFIKAIGVPAGLRFPRLNDFVYFEVAQGGHVTVTLTSDGRPVGLAST